MVTLGRFNHLDHCIGNPIGEGISTTTKSIGRHHDTIPHALRVETEPSFTRRSDPDNMTDRMCRRMLGDNVGSQPMRAGNLILRNTQIDLG